MSDNLPDAASPGEALQHAGPFDRARNLFAAFRDLGIILAALLFYVGYVYNYAYEQYFGISVGVYDEPIQYFPADSAAVLLDNKSLIAACAFVGIIGAVWWLDASKNESRIARWFRKVPRIIIVLGSVAVGLVIIAKLDDYTNEFALSAARDDQYEATYWVFSFSNEADGIDPAMRKANDAHSLRGIDETRELYITKAIAGPATTSGDAPPGSCVLVVPKRLVLSVRVEALDPERNGTGEQRYASCGEVSQTHSTAKRR